MVSLIKAGGKGGGQQKAEGLGHSFRGTSPTAFPLGGDFC